MIFGAGHVTPAIELFWAGLLMGGPVLPLVGAWLIWDSWWN